MAHKKEFEHDPVREGIVAGYNWLKKNLNSVLLYGVIIIAIIVGAGTMLNNREQGLLTSVGDFGKAQNFFIDGQTEFALNDFQSVIDKYDGKPGADFARIYLAKDHIEKGRYTDAIPLLDAINIDDKFIQAQILAMKGDIALNSSDTGLAANYYQKAIKKCDLPNFKDSYKLSLMRCKVAEANYDEAIKIGDALLANDKLKFNVKNSVEELMAFSHEKSH